MDVTSSLVAPSGVRAERERWAAPVASANELDDANGQNTDGLPTLAGLIGGGPGYARLLPPTGSTDRGGLCPGFVRGAQIVNTGLIAG